MIKEHTYFIKGMHCASCEILVEKKLLEIVGVRAVEASTAHGKATIEYDSEKPSLGKINEIFEKDNYIFFDAPYTAIPTVKKEGTNKTLVALAVATFIIMAFLLLDKMGISGFLNVGSKSSLVAFFGFGLLAGLSSCAALVGGIILSMSKQWSRLYDNAGSSYPDGNSSGSGQYQKFEPHLLFNVGRILSYVILGGVLGLIGSRLQVSFTFTALLVMVISLLMIALGLQMLGVPAFRKFQFSMPRFITRKIANESNFNGKYMPFVMGALTFFLPCGFTITAQSLALLSGSPLQGALILGVFSLGTAPMLLLMGFSSVTFLSRPHLAQTFSKVAGFLVLFFALYNMYNQLNVLGVII